MRSSAASRPRRVAYTTRTAVVALGEVGLRHIEHQRRSGSPRPCSRPRSRRTAAGRSRHHPSAAAPITLLPSTSSTGIDRTGRRSVAAMDDPVFTGVGVALVTLFDDDGERRPRRHRRRSPASSPPPACRPIVIAGSTGEAAALDGAERVALVKVVREAIPADVPIVVGTGAPSARQAARLTSRGRVRRRRRRARAVAAGAPPTRSPTTPRSCGAAGAVPVLGYHFPPMSAPGIDVDVLPRLADVGVVGLKDSSGDPSRLVRTLDDVRRRPLRRLAVAAVGGRSARRDRRDPRRRQRRARAVDRRLRRRRRRPARARRGDGPAAGPAGVKPCWPSTVGRVG